MRTTNHSFAHAVKVLGEDYGVDVVVHKTGAENADGARLVVYEISILKELVGLSALGLEAAISLREARPSIQAESKPTSEADMPF